MAETQRSKRGEAGRKLAVSHPFRINGMPENWQALRIGVHKVPAARSGGSTTMRGFIGGVLAMRVTGVGFAVDNPRFEAMLAHAEARCTVIRIKYHR